MAVSDPRIMASSMLHSSFHFAATAKFNVIDIGGAPNGGEMVTPTASSSASSLAAAVTRQASTVRELKKAHGASAPVVLEAVKKLEALRSELSTTTVVEDHSHELNRKVFDETVLRRMFVVPAFEIHGGVSGLYDLGPPGAALKANLVDQWRRHFVLEEKMLEMECTCLTPEPVLKTSGHVDRFTDLMVKDVETGDCYRADKLLEDTIDAVLETCSSEQEAEEHKRIQRQADAYSATELDDLLRNTYKVKAPATGNELTQPFAFNLMFGTKIGPSGTLTGYLRPETAQGLFVNFRRLLDYNNGRVPFAAAQVGLGFRNEIAPKNGLLRVREFTMAEIEHFVDPSDKSHPKFASVSNVTLRLFDREAQLTTGKVTEASIGDAVHALSLVANETLGYFMARTQLYANSIGLDIDKLRFRQHLATEMAHYAADCWDLEVLTAYGWVECVGHADRACYDLDVHAKQTKVEHKANRLLKQTKTVETVVIETNKRLIGTTFKADQKQVVAALETLEDPEAFATSGDFPKYVCDGKFAITKDMISIKKAVKTVSAEKFVPSVIEPSFGIGRLLHALLEHSFHQRDGDEQRIVMRFPARVAPIKCALFPLQSNPDFNPVVAKIERDLTDAGLANKIDASGVSVGRRYSRADELGTPFGITVDFQTLDDNTVTVRERDSMTQVRVPLDQLIPLVRRLVYGDSDEKPVSWTDATAAFGTVGDAPPTAQKSNLIVDKTPRATFSRPTDLIVP